MFLCVATLLYLTIIITTSCCCDAFEKREEAHGKTIIAYYASWQIYDRNGLAKPINLDYTKFTRLNFAFFQPSVDGEIYGTDEWADPWALFGDWDWSGTGTEKCSWDAPGEPPVCGNHIYETGLVHLSHKAGVEIYPSIGGWTLSNNFPPMAANPESRKNFARNCARLVEHYDFDGIDIDWEYPTYAAHNGGPADTENYSLLIQDIRAELDALGQSKNRFYGLTAAMPCGPDLIKGIDLPVVKESMTEFNLMSYDLHGSWSPQTGPNAPLYDFEGSPELSVHGCTENFLKGGVQKSQINIGLPFYGRSFLAGYSSALTGFGQSFAGEADTSTWSDDEGIPQYYNIMKKISQFTSVRHEPTKTQFAYNSFGLVSYDDELAICDKTEYAVDNDLNGFIIWEISGDIMDDLSTPLLDAIDVRLNNPETRCDGSSDASSNPPPPPPPPPPTKAPTQKPVQQQTPETPKPTFHTNDGGDEETLGDDRFYPHFESDGCRNDSNAPNYISDNMLSTVNECCETYFPYDWIEQCKTNSLDHHPFYPNFRTQTCVNDGKQESYMVGDYLNENHWLCCHNFYSYSEELLEGCLGKGYPNPDR